jgi:hypothetical protein
MENYKIVFYQKDTNQNTGIIVEKYLIDYEMKFRDMQEAEEWAVLTAQTHSTYKNLSMIIDIQSLTQLRIIYYYGE